MISISSCKKDYPDDIPSWLKEKIREYKKEAETGDTYFPDFNTCIMEYSNESNIIYSIRVCLSPVVYDYYDYNGNYLCNMNGDVIPYLPCGSIDLSEYTYTRTVWVEHNY